MDKAYINRKIRICKELVETSTSEDQKKIYQEYLDYWSTKEHMEVDLKNAERIVQELEPLLQKKLREAKEEIEEIELEAIDNFDTIDNETELEFKAENPNKRAFYSRNGEMHITKAYKEFLNKETQ